MNNIILPFILIAIFASAHAADVKIAIINSDEIKDLIRVKVLAKPENVDSKKKLIEIDKRNDANNKKLMEVRNDEEKKKVVMADMMAIHEERNVAGKEIENQITGELIKTIKEVSKGRYIVVLDSEKYNDAIIVKDAEIVDITLDIKEFLLVK